MSISSPLLPLFKEQLEAECAQIASEYNLTDRGHWLIYWYFMRLHNFSDTNVDEIFCDGGGDLGIDALWIDDDDYVHFYQFKNPADADRGFPAGDIDKVLGGLRLILLKKYDKIANPNLKSRIQEIYQQVRRGYRLHLVTSGHGVESDARVKLDAIVAELRGPSSGIFEWCDEPLQSLQDRFYEQNLPAIEDPIVFRLIRAPYMHRSGSADCYFFHSDGSNLADLYQRHGEGLLQRNIRVDQRDTATNRSIESTCSGSESANFIHFNNGISFLSDSATFDQFQSTITLHKAQVVNGGQTIRALARAQKKGLLKSDVLVPVRAITSNGDKDFGNSVAVNLNNQNQMGTGFLRSTDQRIIQLDHALASLGWYLERRDGEIKNATPVELAAISHRIGRDLAGHVITLKEGAQAYTATFFGQPELAKKNAKKIFASIDEGGYFERIFSADMTAEKIVIAHQLKASVDEFVRQYTAIKRKYPRVANDKNAYRTLLGDAIVDEHAMEVQQVMPQCALFVCGTIFRDLRDFKKMNVADIPSLIQNMWPKIVREHLYYIMAFARQNQEKADRSWPVLLKSNTFFGHVISYIQGIRVNQPPTPK